jgi:hypothetical protein
MANDLEARQRCSVRSITLRKHGNMNRDGATSD